MHEFASAAAAEKAAAAVATNCGSIGTAMMSWMAPPHFFRKERVIVNYLGTSEKTLAALRNLLGSGLRDGRPERRRALPTELPCDPDDESAADLDVELIVEIAAVASVRGPMSISAAT